MSQFYARYIPPPASSASPAKSVPANDKREAANERGPKESKKRKIVHENGEEVLAKYSSSKATKRRDENVSIETRNERRSRKSAATGLTSYKPGAELPTTSTTSHVEKGELDPSQSEVLVGKNIARKKGVENGSQSSKGPVSPSRDSPDLNAKHAKVLSRFRSNAPTTDEQDKATTNDGPQQEATYHDLEPIPQPESSIPRAVARYSTAPEWLRQPIQVEQKLPNSSLKDLGIGKVILGNLKTQDIVTALPVQSTVLPLLLNKDVHQRHDLCVAAATGSGKTLAYILPILNDLRNRSEVQLRAVIVVPTRALVKQVVQTIDSCSAGVDVKIGTAEGSKALVDEQAQLVAKTQELDLDEWQRQRDAPIDWSTFSLEETLKQASEKVSIANVGYVTGYHSQVDILVCTPGRLVEHLQTTKGFNLDNVDWFVADEADRLLNESYHEWLETVLPALKSQTATKKRDDLLRSMYMDVPFRRVTKILLSATMTRDISQLLLLQLVDPKLVVMADDSPAEDAQDQVRNTLDNQADYQVPTQLEETAIAFRDSENKPLYLLHLLQHSILSPDSASNGASHATKALTIRQKNDVDDTSSSGSSDSETEDHSSDTSSSSDSESESDATSVSSLSSSSSDSTTSKADSERIVPSSTSPNNPRVLIFTKSTESAHRLSRLLALLEPNLAPKIATFSRSTSSTKSSSVHKTRSKILEAFSTGKTPLLICTDLAARGLDIPSLEHVINYDVPSSALTYVHRVGRTARAGREGKAWTLVEHKQGKWFWETIGGKARLEASEAGAETKVIGRGGKTVQKLNVVIDREKWMERYELALAKLGEDVRAG